MKKQIIFIARFAGLIFIAGCGIGSFDTNNMPVDGASATALGQGRADENTTSEKIHHTTQWENSPYDDFYANIKPVGDIGVIKGAVVPHHLLAGYLPATIFDYLKKQKTSVVVIFAPNHFQIGPSNVLTTLWNYQTQFGRVKISPLAQKMVDAGVAKTNETGFENEHGVGGLVPMLARSLPNSKILPIIFQWDTPTGTIDSVLTFLKNNLPDDAVIISSIDFSHYQTWPVANFHDEYTRSVIHNFDFSDINATEIDSHPSLYALMRMMEYYQTEKIAWEGKDNSASIANRPNAKETTSHYAPMFVKGAPDTKPIAAFLFFGDMMLDRNVKKAIGQNSPDWIFEKLAGQENRFFSGMNFVHANLEGPFADSRRSTTKSIAFRFDPKLITTLKKYNFNIFDVANNHSLDMGQAGLKESEKNLTTAGIDFYGDGYDIGDYAIKIKEVNGVKIAFVGFNDTYFRLDKNKIANTVKKAAAQSDLVVVNIHWGDEYKTISNARQRELARLMIDTGADVIIGHHPHVVEEIEIYKNRPIFYSLGNFVFDQYFSKETQQGLAVGLVASTSTLSVSVFPLRSIGSQVAQMDYAVGFEYFRKLLETSRLSGYNFTNFNLKINL